MKPFHTNKVKKNQEKAISLKKKGYSVRQVMKKLKYKSPNSVQNLLKKKVSLTREFEKFCVQNNSHIYVTGFNFCARCGSFRVLETEICHPTECNRDIYGNCYKH